MMAVSRQSREYGRLAARHLLVTLAPFDAQAVVARKIADTVAGGGLPHPDHVRTYQVLSRLVLLRQAQWRAAMSS